MPSADPYPGTPSPNTLADATKMRAQLDALFGSSGKAIVATSQARTNTAYGTLTTPDQVTGIVLPTDGLLFVAYQARWASSVSGAGRAAIFVGSNQLQDSTGAVEEAGTNATSTSSLYTFAGGLIGGTDAANTVTTGQPAGNAAGNQAGGVCAIFAAAGTYTVSIQFKASSGSVTADFRHLWVWTRPF